MTEFEEYLVTWDIEITAENPIEAARQALAVQRNPDSMATVFHVNGERIDLDAIEDDLAIIRKAGMNEDEEDEEDEEDDEAETCSDCGADLAVDAGEGYDGLCGSCADRAERQGRWS